jgi:hypothetical protein|tara:strand:+ start:196 stop:321 length:126 start_codon:yes stop_codon:yes gene_type:complete
MMTEPAATADFEDTIAWGEDEDEVIVASCDLSNPDICESCT